MAKFVTARSSIKISDQEGNSFNVRGLSLTDISQLASLHRSAVDQVLDRFAELDPEALTMDDIAKGTSSALVSLIEQVPLLLAHLIALGADDLENVEDYSELPIGVQMDAASEIGSLTIRSMHGPERLIALVATIAKTKPKTI